MRIIDIVKALKRRIKRGEMLVSVVVPIYNGADTVARCLDSLLHQTQRRIKIICVNDGSTDETFRILRKYKLRHWNIRIINQKNSGRSVARNAGLKSVKTKYVMFCDCDDYYNDNMCKKMIDAISENNVDVAVCGIAVHYDAHDEMMKSDEEYYRIKLNGDIDINEAVILQTDASVCNKIFRMDLISRYGVVFPVGLNNEDFYFWNAYASLCNRAFFMKDKLYNYVRHEGSIMSKNFEAKDLSIDHLLVAEELFDFYRKTGFLSKHIDLFWRQWIASFWFSYEHSASEYRWKIKEAAINFLGKEYEKNPPTDKELLQWKKDIDNTLKKIKGGNNDKK